ncbi:MAG: glycosyltransferase [Gemmatimonadaceae bacterium]
MSNGSMDIEFSVVSGAREDLLFACLESLYSTMHGSTYSWIVTATCNSPGMNLAQRLKEHFPTIETIENALPRGFAANHNTVLSSSAARYVWLLNDDLIILPDTIEEVTRYMDAPGNERVGALSPKLLNPDGTLQPSTYSFPTMPQIMLAHSGLRELGFTQRVLRIASPILRSRKGSSRFWAHDETIAVDTFRGACVAVRMSAVREVGLMAEASQVGAEETEWHRRFHQHRWKVVFFADASVIHYGSQTVGESEGALQSEYLKGVLNYFRLHRPAASVAVFCAALLSMYSARLASARIRGDRKGADIARNYLRVVRTAMHNRRGAT